MLWNSHITKTKDKDIIKMVQKIKTGNFFNKFYTIFTITQ